MLLKPLRAAAVAVLDAATVAHYDDISVVGKPAALRDAFQRLCGTGAEGVGSVGLRVRPSKCSVHGGIAAQCATLATDIDVQHCPDGVVVVGVPVGSEAFKTAHLAHRADAVVGLVNTLTALPMAAQS